MKEAGRNLGSKTFRSLAAAPDAHLASVESRRRIPFDAEVWLPREAGDYVNIETGELREEDEFDFHVAGDMDSDIFGPDPWDEPQAA